MSKLKTFRIVNKSVDPIIKDLKIRKAVRAWADVIRSIKFKAEFRKAIDIESGYYTIAELCGEEEDDED